MTSLQKETGAYRTVVGQEAGPNDKQPSLFSSIFLLGPPVYDKHLVCLDCGGLVGTLRDYHFSHRKIMKERKKKIYILAGFTGFRWETFLLGGNRANPLTTTL